MKTPIRNSILIALASGLVFVPAAIAVRPFRTHKRAPDRKMKETEASTSDETMEQLPEAVQEEGKQESSEQAQADTVVLSSSSGEPIPVKKTPRRAQWGGNYVDYYYHGGGKKSGGGGGKKGGGGNIPQCQVLSVFVLIEDLQSGFFTNDVGDGFDAVPIYDAITGDWLGTYSEADIFTNQASDADDQRCVYTGAFSFDFAPDYHDDGDAYLSQINIAATCQSAFDAVTGGSGAYGCANGYLSPGVEDDTTITVNIHLCGPLCPAVPDHHYFGW